MWRFFAITNSSRLRAKSGQLHWDKPAQFAACEVVFSEAQAAFQPSSCCSQRRAGLAFSGEISIPARRWQYNHDMTSCLEGTASLGIVFPVGKQRNNTGGKVPRALCCRRGRGCFALWELAAACPSSSSPPCVTATPWRGGLSPRGCLSFSHAVGSSTGVFALARLTLLDQLSEIPGLPCRCQRRVLQTLC